MTHGTMSWGNNINPPWKPSFLELEYPSKHPIHSAPTPRRGSSSWSLKLEQKMVKSEPCQTESYPAMSNTNTRKVTQRRKTTMNHMTVFNPSNSSSPRQPNISSQSTHKGIHHHRLPALTFHLNSANNSSPNSFQIPNLSILTACLKTSGHMEILIQAEILQWWAHLSICSQGFFYVGAK